MLVAAGVVFALATAVGAAGDTARRGASESANPDMSLRQLERIMLGPEHAREHAELRREARAAARRHAKPPPSQRHERAKARASARAAGPRDQVGAWTQAPFDLPNYAIHAAMLPTGKVLFYGYFFGAYEPGYPGRAALWDPSAGTGPGSFTIVDPPEVDLDGDGESEPAPIFCSGVSTLPDGSVLVAGGRLPSREQAARGPDLVFTFDPWRETWIEQPSTEQGRYYPSQVELADGRTAILGGYSDQEPGGIDNPELEVFTPAEGDPDAQGTIQRFPSGDRVTSVYPHLFTLPDGNVLLAGQNEPDSALLSTEDFTWTELPQQSRQRRAGTAVLRPEGPQGSWTVTQIGGYDRSDADGSGNIQSVASSETIDAGDPAPQWHPDASLNIARANHNTVLLPDGSMVTVGGGIGKTEDRGNFGATEDQKQVELYDPATNSWRLGPAQVETRAYHSTALLLPNGKVFSSGDNGNPLNENGKHLPTDTAEVYSPPYLFRGGRPKIRRTPETIGYGQRFRIRTRNGLGERAVLMAPGAVTHAVDNHQRLVSLALKDHVEGVGLDVFSPPRAGVAPPGYYMLFVVDADGVPSKAAWVQLG